jgi:hypothetical protein
MRAAGGESKDPISSSDISTLDSGSNSSLQEMNENEKANST